jgi:pimeloyl-ACP methyl ester carboxylesterase
MVNRILWALVLGLAVFTQAEANRGVAFIHGTGRQTNALDDYWQRPFVDGVRAGLPNSANYVVINCNFEKYWWDPAAAGCLATQLTDFINQRGITEMTLITHSNGGNVVRWILSNPTWDSRYPNIINKTRKVIALAPSSAGTPLANAVMNGTVFEQSLGWLLGYQSDAVRQQQTHWMSTYNAQYLFGTAGRPALPKSFRPMVGTDVRTAVWSGNAYCGGYHLNLGLEVTSYWLDSCSDGFLNCSSQAAAGSVWFYDYQRTTSGYVLNHNQSRRDCFGLTALVRGFL